MRVFLDVQKYNRLNLLKVIDKLFVQFQSNEIHEHFRQNHKIAIACITCTTWYFKYVFMLIFFRWASLNVQAHPYFNFNVVW